MKTRHLRTSHDLARSNPLRLVIAGVVLTVGFAMPRIGSLLRATPPATSGPPRLALNGGALPPTLSATGLFADLATLRPADDLVPYEINIAFWSDGAAKTRWLRLPPGTRMKPRDDGTWQLPPGTTLVKHFEIATDAKLESPRRLETRVLVVAADGAVDGATYRWRPDGRDADIVYTRAEDHLTMRAADATFFSQSWHYMPSADCRTCHTPQAGGALGLTTGQLNREINNGGARAANQIDLWRERGLLTTAGEAAARPKMPSLDDAAIPIETRARAWLAVNCAQCHTPGGAPTEFDLRFTTPLDAQHLIDGRPRINLGIDNARLIAPNDPWRSMILRRVETLDGNRMPPLAHERVDEQGRALLREWIASLPGPPVLPPPVIAARDGAHVPITITVTHPDPSATIRYTLDGSAPTGSSPACTGSIHLDKPTTLRVRAFRDGHTRSIVAQETFTR